MPFKPVQSEKLSQAVVQQIEQLILRGILRPGERLPSERTLSDQMRVSRPSLREAVADLQTRGLLDSRAGAGLYVADSLNASFPAALSQLFSTHNEAVFDYLDFRSDMEGLAAERAARLGSDTDLQVIDTIFKKMETASLTPDTVLEADLDTEFHLSIIEASHNVIMLHMMRSMYDLLRKGVLFNRQVIYQQSNKRTALLDQHRAINDALQARDAAASRAAVTAHMSFVKSALKDQQTTDQNEKVARLRLEHEKAR